MLEQLGPYRLERRLAVGGTAEIWLAVPEAGSGRVAVKRMLPELRVHPEAHAMFSAEAAYTVRCAHPQVIAVHGHGQDGPERYIALEHIDGPDLAALAPGGLTAPALRAMISLLGALEHVHGCGVVHGDVNPRNVLLRATGEAVLIDFGVASEVSASEGVRPARGTWAYMSPEQVQGQPMDGRSDVFAAGAVLWELASGQRLFRRDQAWLTMAAIVEDEVPPLADPTLDAICRAALAKDRDRRTPSAAALAAALAALAGV
jgi:serine/threonine protein kinase